MHLRVLLVLALCALMARPAQAQDHTQMLPLAVGNSWEYQLDIRFGQVHDLEVSIPISITHTEEIFGITYEHTYSGSDFYTYYVFSDLPKDWSGAHFPGLDLSDPFNVEWVEYRIAALNEWLFPVPFFFLAGKKVRWSSDGKALFLQALWNQEAAVFRFDGDYKVREIYRLFPALLGRENLYLADWSEFPPGFPYTTDGIKPPYAGYPDHSVTVESSFSKEGARVVEFRFPQRVEFTTTNLGLYEGRLGATFVEGLGLFAASGETDGIDCNPSFPPHFCGDDMSSGMRVNLRLESAVIGGVRWAAGEPIPTAVQERSWGAVKHRFRCPNCEE